MTTPEKPEYMFPELQGLPDEFRRLAAEAELRMGSCDFKDLRHWYDLNCTWEQAAQMLEERLNG